MEQGRQCSYQPHQSELRGGGSLVCPAQRVSNIGI